MDDIEGGAVEGTEVQAPAALGRERRMTAGRKREAVLRLLRGEPLELVARELAVTAADLSAWRDAFLEAGEASLKSRPRDDRDATIGRLRTKVGELTMDNELLYAKVERLESGAPFRGAEIEAMSAVVSISAGCRYGVARVLPRLGRRPLGRLPQSPCGGRAARAEAPAGAAGSDGRCRPRDGDPAGVDRQPLPRRGLPQGLGAAAPRRPAHLQGARAPP